MCACVAVAGELAVNAGTLTWLQLLKIYEELDPEHRKRKAVAAALLARLRLTSDAPCERNGMLRWSAYISANLQKKLMLLRVARRAGRQAALADERVGFDFVAMRATGKDTHTGPVVGPRAAVGDTVSEPVSVGEPVATSSISVDQAGSVVNLAPTEKVTIRVRGLQLLTRRWDTFGGTIRADEVDDNVFFRARGERRPSSLKPNSRYNDSLTGDALETYTDAALEAEALRMRLGAETAARVKAQADAHILAGALATQQKFHEQALAAQAEASASAMADQQKKHERQHKRQLSALEKEREKTGDMRALVAQKDEQLRLADERRVADLRQQDASLRSNNQATHARARVADELERRLEKAEGKWKRASDALAAERDKRKDAEVRVLNEQEAAIAAARVRDTEVRSKHVRAK